MKSFLFGLLKISLRGGAFGALTRGSVPGQGRRVTGVQSAPCASPVDSLVVSSTIPVEFKHFTLPVHSTVVVFIDWLAYFLNSRDSTHAGRADTGAGACGRRTTTRTPPRRTARGGDAGGRRLAVDTAARRADPDHGGLCVCRRATASTTTPNALYNFLFRWLVVR